MQRKNLNEMSVLELVAERDRALNHNKALWLGTPFDHDEYVLSQQYLRDLLAALSTISEVATRAGVGTVDAANRWKKWING